jgi:hypothetical protein
MRGLYAKKITLNRYQKVSDGQGGYADNQVIVVGTPRMAHVSIINDTRAVEGYQNGNNLRYLVKVDARGFDVILTDIITYVDAFTQGGFKILHVDNIENKGQRNKEFYLTCTERKTL